MNEHLALARPDILALSPYAAGARVPGFVRLNANESPWPGAGGAASDLNRYPESRSVALTGMFARYLGLDAEQLLLTRGSDDAIDCLVRVFCRAGRDSVMVTPPTFAMYALAARIQGAGVIEAACTRDEGFRVDTQAMLDAWRPGCKLVFLCSPNNPTGTVVPADDIARLAAALAGRALLVVDEAYIEFAETGSVVSLLAAHPNLVVLRTLSKAHGLAGARVGAAAADPAIVALLSVVLPPFPLSAASQAAAREALADASLARMADRVARIRREREKLVRWLAALDGVADVYPGQGNFVLVRTDDAAAFVARCRQHKVLVRDLSGLPGLFGCVRISVGSDEEMGALRAGFEDLAHAS